ncbi:MAG: hypothetical protein IPM29_25180 [Planctomycetes bacterium]|nr:hypothetical protein [Planctomycetota bacterium]
MARLQLPGALRARPLPRSARGSSASPVDLHPYGLPRSRPLREVLLRSVLPLAVLRPALAPLAVLGPALAPLAVLGPALAPLAVLGPALAPLGAQSAPRAGFEATTLLVERNSPYGFAGFAVGASPDELYYAVDHIVYRLDPQGLAHQIRTFAVGERAGLLVHPARSTALYYTNLATDRLYRRELVTGAEQTLTAPSNAFDLDVSSTGELLVSADPSWPAPGSHAGLWRVDPAGGVAHRELVALSGPSGPLLVDRATDDVYYVTQSRTFPTPPGSLRLLRFPGARIRAALAGGPALTEADATTIATGLDGGYDLARDDRGAFWVSDPHAGGVWRIDPRTGRDPVPLLPPGPMAALGLAFVDAGTPTFDAFQPADGAVLLVAESDWFSASSVRALRPARPELGSPTGPNPRPGIVGIRARGLPPGPGVAWLLVNDRLTLPRRAIATSPDGIPLFTELDLLVPPIVVGLAIAPDGSAGLDLLYGAPLGVPLSFQALAIGDRGWPVSSTPLTLHL